MGRRNMDHKRAYDRERIRRIRAQRRAEQAATNRAWYERQLGPDHDEPPIGVTLKQHRAWAKFVLGLRPLDELFPNLPDVRDLLRD